MNDKQKRRHLRFAPDRHASASIDLNAESAEFTNDISALIVDEAPMGGTCLFVLRAPELADGKKVKVKVGELSPLRGVVVWRAEVAEDIAKIGIRFLE